MPQKVTSDWRNWSTERAKDGPLPSAPRIAPWAAVYHPARY
jgi:hypothetical protein